MITRFVVSTLWRHKGLALMGLAYYLFTQGKKREEESVAPVHSTSSGKSSRDSHRRK